MAASSDLLNSKLATSDTAATANALVQRDSSGGITVNAVTATTVSATTLAGTTGAFTGRVTTTDGVASGTAKVVGGLVSSATAAGSALTASASETVLGSSTVKANSLKAGSVLKVRYQGIVTADNSTTTLTVRLRVGPTTLTGTAVISHAATDTGANNIFTGYCELVARAAPGATAACVAVTQYNDPAATGAAVKAGFMASTNFATNGDLLVEVTGQWNASDANSCRLDILNVEIT